ncbi:GtrA family protein [Haploplasma axanthum]|uniref:GtrA-like protein n=1 Tax=Haploplasma axanthum TaxID=29552 RepID=A0A449BCS2_HAPAX|nr:GtrA family protein [Haploplasma axanthum]VEU80236.1 Uncharacterised protein [Haploplasma axanthum]
MSKKIKVVEELSFNTSSILLDKKQETKNLIKLEAANKKLSIKKQLKEQIKASKEKSDDLKIIADNKITELHEITNQRLNEIEEQYNPLIEAAKEKEALIVRKKETINEKETRTGKIKNIKLKVKTQISENKALLKTVEKDSEEYNLIKQNIKTLKKNQNNQIIDLNKEVEFNPITKLLTNVGKFFARIGKWFSRIWKSFKSSHPTVAQFLVFFMISNGVTVLQLVMMPLFKYMFNQTDLINISLQFGRIGNNLNGTPYYMFNYPAGELVSGVGGGLAYFLAVQVTIAIAQIINFFTQRSVTFKSNSNAWVAALWYFIAYVAITFIAAAAQGLYKAPIYDLFMNKWSMGKLGEIIADGLTMIINSAISFWVFFPIMKIIFKQEDKETK